MFLQSPIGVASMAMKTKMTTTSAVAAIVLDGIAVAPPGCHARLVSRRRRLLRVAVVATIRMPLPPA